MKERILRITALLLAFLMPIIIAVSCGRKKPAEPKDSKSESEKSTESTPQPEFIFRMDAPEGARLETSGNVYELHVGSDVEMLQMTKYVKVGEGIFWMLATDVSMLNQIPNKIVSLKEGKNVFYVYCHNSDDSIMETYAVNIYRSANFIVTFEGLSETQAVAGGAFARVPEGIPQKEGYDFAEWDFDFGTPISASTLISAKWTPKTFTITFDPAEGSVAVAAMTAVYGEEVDLPVPEREGFTFADWFNGDERVSSGPWSIAANVTLTAHWASGTYRITFDPDGGVIDGVSVIEAGYGSEITFPIPVREGFSFAGWFAGNELISDGLEPVVFTFTSDLDLVARWEESAVKLNFFENGGSKNTHSETLAFGADLPVPRRTGYTFGGWFSDEKLTKEVTVAPNVSMNLYAWWTEEGKPGEFVYNVSGISCTVTARVDPDSEAVVPEYIGGRKTVDAIPRPNADAGVKLEKNSVIVYEGRTGVIKASFVPRFEYDDVTLTFSCDTPSVAEVDQTGAVKGLKAGACLVTVSNEASGMSAICILIVSNEGRKTPSISFEDSELSMTVEEKSSLVYAYVPEYPTDDKTITFVSSDESVAKVNQNGEVTAVAPGSCTVTAKDAYGVTAEITVTVAAPTEQDPPSSHTVEEEPASGQ